jgi:hypothetical protein
MNLFQSCLKKLRYIIIGALALFMVACSGSNDSKKQKSAVQKIFDTGYVSFQDNGSNFPLVENGKAATVVIDANDHEGLLRIVNYFKEDVLNVTGSEPNVIMNNIPGEKNLVIVGSIDNSPLINQLVKAGKLDVSKIEGNWENSLIEVVENPFDGVERALVITGSDKRGTYYGLLDVSRKMGVSPWHWWADVPVDKHENVYIKNGRYDLGEPNVKYRGIFLNDEEPALGRWAVENYGGFNHQFYEKVFELMLRLKGNYMWPAMWWASFNSDDPMNRKIADEMGIVMGTSHHEPMDRAHAEWKAKKEKGHWNYETNAEELREFWRKGIERIGNREVIINMGMRGDGDMAMSEDTNIELLEEIVADQRDIIKDVTGKELSEVPQMWALYKEVQDYYDHGMRVPDDITLLLCDDNWGNIRKLPKPGTPERSGGYGIYYHFDYVGGPRNYKWLNTSPLPRIWEQMNLAYEHGVKELWLVNVGDLKPMEYPISFWLDYAWNPERINANDLDAYANLWAKEQFGEEKAEDIAHLMTMYTKYNSRRKPESIYPGMYSILNYNEAENFVDNYNALFDQAVEVEGQLPDNMKDAYYQLVKHPIEACSNLNDLYVTVAKNRLYAKQNRSVTNKLAQKAGQLYQNDAAITEYYHNEVSGGKWNNMMNQTHIGYTYWQQPEKNSMPEVKNIDVPDKPLMGVAVSGSEEWWPNTQKELDLPVINPYSTVMPHIDVYTRGSKSFRFDAEAGTDWLNLSMNNGRAAPESRIEVSANWKDVPEGEHRVPVTITGPEGRFVVVHANVFKPAIDKKEIKGFVEAGGCISIEAGNFSRKVDADNASWREIPGLGRTVSAMHPVPVNSNPVDPNIGSPVLEYDVHFFSTGKFEAKFHLSPTQNIYNDEGLEFAVSIDGGEPQVVNMHEGYSFRDWEQSVLNNTIFASAELNIKVSGNHIIKVWMVDPGIVLQKIVVYTGDPRYTYLGPPQSAIVE